MDFVAATKYIKNYQGDEIRFTKNGNTYITKVEYYHNNNLISFSELSDFDYSDFKNCSIKMLSLSDKIIFAGPVPSYLADAALDRGMDIAVLKDFLCYESTRRLAKDGAAVIDTFSSWLEYPEHIAYEEMDSGLLYLRVMDF